MATATPQTAPPAHAPDARREILIVSHSTLYYWWSVWAVGFVMGFITLFSGDRMATIPDGSVEEHKAKQVVVTNAKGDPTTYENRDVLVAPKDRSMHATA